MTSISAAAFDAEYGFVGASIEAPSQLREEVLKEVSP